MKKILSLVLALAMVLMVGAAFAANDGTITITPPDNNPADAQNSYAIYKVPKKECLPDSNWTVPET